MTHQHGGHRAVKPLSPSRTRTVVRLTLMIVSIVSLASAAVWQRARLAPAFASAAVHQAGPVAAPASQLVQLIDGARERAGCAALRLSGPLTASAQAHAADMAAMGYASESGPDGSSPQERATRAGYRGQVAEIVAAGIPAPGAVFAQWTNRGNPAATGVMAKMTDCGYISAGIGYDPDRVMPTFMPGTWVVDLGTR